MASHNFISVLFGMSILFLVSMRTNQVARQWPSIRHYHQINISKYQWINLILYAVTNVQLWCNSFVKCCIRTGCLRNVACKMLWWQGCNRKTLLTNWLLAKCNISNLDYEMLGCKLHYATVACRIVFSESWWYDDALKTSIFHGV